MWEAIVVVAVTFGVIGAGIALLWASLSPQPSHAVALVDPDACVLAHHEHARVEMQAIERVTRQLMRAAAHCGEPPGAVLNMRRTTGVASTWSSNPAVEPSFAWSPDPVASSSTAAGSVTSFASNTWRRS